MTMAEIAVLIAGLIFGTIVGLVVAWFVDQMD